MLRNLVELGVLTQQEHRSLWIFRVQRYSLTDTSIQQAIADQVRAAVLEDVGLDSRTAALISLIRAVAKGERVGKAVSDTIASIQAAISVSMMFW